MNTTELLGEGSLTEHIIATIEQADERMISFRDYMNLCLYERKLGYYMKAKAKIGKEGDFYTSSSIGPFMGQMLAGRFAQYASENNGSILRSITEWGSGAGRLALQILDELQNVYPDVYRYVTYYIIEASPYHQELQRAELHAHLDKVCFIEADQWWQEPPLEDAVIFSNELLDAFPVHMIRLKDSQYHEVYVTYEHNANQFVEVLRPLPEDSELYAYIQRFPVNGLEGQTYEINIAAEQWVRRVARKLISGQLITIDYGDEAVELYAAHRYRGTLMCYYQHTAHENPYIHIGDQDITAHVNFSSCMLAGSESGLDIVTYQSQRQFLLEQGILTKLQDHSMLDPFHPIARSNRAIRQLLLGDTMSELFKVLIQHRKSD